MDGVMIGELVRRSVGKHSNTVGLIRYNINVCYVSNVNALFEAYRCPSSDKFFNEAENLESSTSYKERVKHIFLKQ